MTTNHFFWPITNAQLIRMRDAWTDCEVEVTESTPRGKPTRAVVRDAFSGFEVDYYRQNGSKDAMWIPDRVRKIE